MKKKLHFILYLFMIGTAGLKAQVPNNSFETWHSGALGRLEPNSWITSDSAYSIATVVQDAGHTGTYSAKLTSVYDSTVAYFQGGEIDQDHQLYSGTIRPGNFNGYWKMFNPANQDFIFIDLFMYDSSNAQIGYGGTDSPVVGSMLSWTAFTFPINYTNSNAVSNYTIHIFLSNFSNNPAIAGNIDDLSFDTNTGLNDIQTGGENFSLIRMAGVINQYILNAESPAGNLIRADLYDVTGKLLKQYQTGEGKLILDLHEFRPGIYFCNVTDGNAVKCFRMLVD